MAYRIEAHIVDDGTDEIFTTVTCWGEDKAEADGALADVVRQWPEFKTAMEAGAVVIDEDECGDQERPEVEVEEEEETK
jgi:hypothetical protein